MSLSYFRRRLNETQRWGDAPPAVRYHAAASSVDDDTLEKSGEPFGATYGESGFGTSEVFQELMSKDPKYVPVSDLAEYQQGLIDTGYLPPTYQPTGQWDSASANADRRASRDAFNTTRSGGSFSAASVQTLFRYLGYTMPTSVMDGMLGIATGIVKDAVTAATHPVEVAQEGGFLGGAAVGAGIGAAAGLIGGPLAPVTSGAGAVVGGLVGGVAGFFGDLFDDDEDEDGDWNRIVGALSPIDEIRSGDAKNLFAALSTIMTASALLKAGMVAKAGVQAAGGAKQVVLRDGWKMAARDQVSPGILNQITQAGLKHRTWGAAAVGGTVNAGHELATTGDLGQALRDFGAGAVIGAGVGKFGLGGQRAAGASAKAIKALDAAPLARFQGSNAMKAIQAGYTGMAAPTIVTRGVSELSGGKTAIGEDIESADVAEKLGTAGTVLDWTAGALIYPSRLTPWKANDLVAGVKAMGSNHALLPFVQFGRKEGTATLQLRKAFDKVKETMGRDVDGSFNPTLLGARVNDSYLQYGIEMRAEAAAAARWAKELTPPKNAYERAMFEAKKVKILEEERAALKHTILQEVGDKGDIAGHSATGKQLIDEAMSNPTGMTNFLSTKGFDFNYWAQHQEATELLNARRPSSIRLTTAEVEEQVKNFDPHLFDIPEGAEFELTTVAIDDLADDIVGHVGGKQAKKTLASSHGPEERSRVYKLQDAYEQGSDLPPIVLDEKGKVVDGWHRLQAAWNADIKSIPVFRRVTGKPGSPGYQFTPAVKDEYLVAQDFERFGGVGDEVGEYEAAASRWKEAADALEDATDANRAQLQQAHDDAAESLDRVLGEMKDRDIIDTDIFDALRPSFSEPKVEKRLVNYLQETAKLRPRRNDELTEELAAKGLDRYMAVTTGEDIIDYTHFVKQAEIEGLTEYTRRQGFFDAVSSLGARVDTADIGKIRYNSIIRHLDKTADEVLVDGTGRKVADQIYDEMKNRYSPEWLKRNRQENIKMRGNIVTRESEVTGKATREFFKIDPRDLTADDIVTALKLDEPGVLREGVDVYDAANRIKKSLHVGAAFGADVAHPLATARSLGASLRVNGLTGFNDFMRTTNFAPKKLLNAMPDSSKFKKGSYGYLPQHLRRFHMSLQFSLSPTFDASRFSEAIMFGKIRGGDIPVKAITNPKKFVHEFEEGWVSPLTGQRVNGEAAVQEMIEFGDKVLYGRIANKNFDEMQLQLLHRGMLGFKPREVEYAAAWWLGAKKAAKGTLTEADQQQIRETVMQIVQYGTKRTAIGNTAHFIFFPYLFSQKQISAMVDFTLGAPTRNLLIHEGVRRWYEVSGEDGKSMSQDFSAFMEKHIPIAKELGRINNLAYGVSPGRFFLEGMMDKSTEGKLAQGLTSFFLPGGVHQAVADTAGAGAEQLKNLFVPQVWTDATYDSLGGQKGALGLLERLVPAYRDLDRWFFDSEGSGSPFGAVGAQASATFGKGAPRAQMTEYLEAKRVMGTALDSLATQQGFASWESLKAQQPQLAAVVDDIEGDLGQRFPEGVRLANEFTNKDGLKEQTLFDIASKEDRTEAEEAINTIGTIEAQAKLVAGQTGRTQEEVLRAIAPVIRTFALDRAGDRQFVNLWEGLFRSYYGPLRQVEVA